MATVSHLRLFHSRRRTSAAARLAALPALALLAACSGESAESPAGPSGAAPATVQQDTCSVEIRGERRVCLDCEGRQPSTQLTAVGNPGGGRAAWGDPIAGAALVQVTKRDPTVFVRGLLPSGAKGDVKIPVTYTAPSGTTCTAVAELTVVKPTSLRLLDEWVFVVDSGKVKSASRNGVPQGSVPASVSADLRPVLEQQLQGKKVGEIVGVIVIRYYEVLDQFGDRWTCDGTLTEVVTPKTRKTGGTPVTNGIPDRPDRLFNLEERKKFKPVSFLQLLRVSGCDVRRNSFTLGAAAASSAELTPQQYQDALDAQKGGRKPQPKPKGR